MRGVQYLRDNEVKFGAVAVINKHTVTYPDEIFWFFYNNRINFNANPCTAHPDDPEPIRELAVSPTEYAHFVLRLVDLWIEVDNPQFRVGPADDIIKGVLGKRMRLCRFNGKCHLYMTIGHDGNVYPCDGFLDDRYWLGNLAAMPLSVIMNGAIVNEYYYYSRIVVQDGCGDCEWRPLCHGGCMRTWGARTIAAPQDYEFCQARQLLFSEARGKLAKIGYART